ncbi:MAG: hypothetical protein KJ920_13105 [Actinobacteria bacterium]|nr:hypothetical protein [Actinomycetota bacterium]MCG2679379.1 hypothetical protein [Kiritimatiellia bacterium]
MDKEQNPISCPTFNKQEPAIRHMTEEINKARGPQEKACWAEELLKEVKILIECPQHDGAKLDCMNCRTICQLRDRTAKLVLKAGKLA